MASERWRIVVAEDDEQLAALVEQLLADDGRFEIVGRTADGDEVVRLVEHHAPDLVLMDIGLPGQDGLAATRAIHAHDATRHVVIYTGSSDYGDVARSEAAGAVGYLHKDALASPDLPDALHVLHTNYINRLPDDEL